MDKLHAAGNLNSAHQVKLAVIEDGKSLISDFNSYDASWTNLLAVIVYARRKNATEPNQAHPRSSFGYGSGLSLVSW
ncbi:unnamed protein product [Cylicocyclus nassatus]|uniref:Uncharacterized protein n=1 Tax=Cylicocyclus nassatus TaxID=53992 RepID=A0AA36DLF3_CYLNA|nr:unnamed protein product [Cylicocyclus nassatus]